MPPTTGIGGSNGEVSVVEARGGSGDTWHKMKMFIRQPWFIGTMGAVAWLILLVVVLVLYRQRRHKKKLKNALATKGNYFHLFNCNFLAFYTFPRITKVIQGVLHVC